MLGVIDTEQGSRLIFQCRHKDPRRHMEYGSSWVRAVTE